MQSAAFKDAFSRKTRGSFCNNIVYKTQKRHTGTVPGACRLQYRLVAEVKNVARKFKVYEQAG